MVAYITYDAWDKMDMLHHRTKRLTMAGVPRREWTASNRGMREIHDTGMRPHRDNHITVKMTLRKKVQATGTFLRR